MFLPILYLQPRKLQMTKLFPSISRPRVPSLRFYESLFPGPPTTATSPPPNPPPPANTCTRLDGACRAVAAWGAGSGNGGMAVRSDGRDCTSCCLGCQKVCLSYPHMHVLIAHCVVLQALSLCAPAQRLLPCAVLDMKTPGPCCFKCFTGCCSATW